MIPGLLTSLVVLAVVLVLFLAVQRWLHRQLHAILLMITRREKLSLGLFSLIFFPGVLLHETSHFFMAQLLRVRTGKFSVLPQALRDGTLRLGYVETAKVDVVRDALIGTAPLLAGGVVVSLIGVFQLPVVPLFMLGSQGNWTLFWSALAQLPGKEDFWLWFYLVFAVSSTMLPSASDRRAWLPMVITVAGLVGLALLAGAGQWMAVNLAPGLETLEQTLVMIFAISLVVHAALGLPVGLLAALVSKMTGLKVVG